MRDTYTLHPIRLPELTRTSLRANQRCRKSRWMKLRCVFTTHMSLLLICLYYSYDIASQRCRKSKWMKLRCVFTTHMSLLLIWQRQSTLSKVQMNEAKVCYDVYVHICTMYNFYLYVHIYRAGGETPRASLSLSLSLSPSLSLYIHIFYVHTYILYTNTLYLLYTHTHTRRRRNAQGLYNQRDSGTHSQKSSVYAFMQ